MNKHANDFVTAVGALAEGCGLFMVELLNQGFSRKEALSLTEAFVKSTLQSKPNKEDN